MFFLLRRIEQSLKVKDTKNLLVSDFYFGKDELFAKLSLSKLNMQCILKLEIKLNLKPPIPDLIIYLQAPTSILLERIKNRGLNLESNIKRKYIDSVNDIYMTHFHEYNTSPVLIINTSNVNINNETDYQMLIDQISADINGKYFNPSSLYNYE